jgi:uncharacterized protein (DUF1800 family)
MIDGAIDPVHRSRYRGVVSVVVVLLCAGVAHAASPPRFPPPPGRPIRATLDRPSPADAARFLTQTTFGPTDADIAQLGTVGFNRWLDSQFDAQLTPPTYAMDYLAWVTQTLNEPFQQNDFVEAWFRGALGGPDAQNPLVLHNDQLRQRVAFALSEIFVISQKQAVLSQFPIGLAYYHDILVRNAFGNYRQLLEEVTLSPEMGSYLNMLGNQRADASKNIHPDENYAREVNQLFSIGLIMLNADGTPQLAAGQPIPTYTQDTVSAFAHVFTGWNWSDCGSQGADAFTYCGPDYAHGANFIQPMQAIESYHDNGTRAPDDLPAKPLLSYPNAVNGGVLGAGGTAATDLKFALDNIFNHPNVGPFFCKQLIQRLITSNPSPAYVQRVAAVFNDNGAGVRGDLRAVVRAIVLDAEARSIPTNQADSYGKLREPLLRVAHLWRAMGAQHTCGQNVAQKNSDGSITTLHYAGQPYRYAGYSSTWSTAYFLGQTPYAANSVFNFFRPDFSPAGEMTSRHLLGPEFQITTDSAIVQVSNDANYRSLYLDIHDACAADDQFGDVRIDHARDLALAGSAKGGATDPADRLVDAYNLRFMGGQMSTYMRQILLDYLNPIDSSWSDGSSDWRLERIKRALYLVLTSPEYAIQK